MSRFQKYTKPWIKKENFNTKKSRAKTVIQRIKKSHPKATIALRYNSDFELLVAVILSAQCTDKKVNEVTQSLFKKYKTITDYVNADSAVFEQDIKSTGFYKNKTKNILGAAKKIQFEFGGKLPKTMSEMLTIPGVARKTANVVLGNTYGVVEGIAVDTHVLRISQRLGFTHNENPVKIEQDLMKLLPYKSWFHFTYLIISHGRSICISQKPKCAECPLKDICPSSLI